MQTAAALLVLSLGFADFNYTAYEKTYSAENQEGLFAYAADFMRKHRGGHIFFKSGSRCCSPPLLNLPRTQIQENGGVFDGEYIYSYKKTAVFLFLFTAKSRILGIALQKFLNRNRGFRFNCYTPIYGAGGRGWTYLNMFERQSAILNLIYRERHTTEAILAETFGVSNRTIRKDITALSCVLPIETVRGRYRGGIWLEDWFDPNSNVLSAKQENLLKEMRSTLAGENLLMLNSILVQFAPSKGYR